MPVRPTLRGTSMVLATAALGWVTTVPPAVGAAPREAEPPVSTLCVPAGTLRGAGGQRADVSLCAEHGTARLSLTAPAVCAREGSPARYSCLSSGTWTLRREGRTVLTGTLPGGRDYPGPGTYDVTADVRVRSEPGEVDLRGTVRGRITLTTPRPEPTHRVEVDRTTLRPNGTTLLRYTVARDGESGDDSARFGLIGEEDTGMELSTSDERCGNPLTGAHPSRTRNTAVLDCALTGLQPGRPTTVAVRVKLRERCGTVVSKLGYWIPRGQSLYTGGMLAGPTVGCD
ncbi:hypothetical protein [Streptomyces sp. CRN 30]|uniref:hypothetical protein n=1 Tax=Streptomyces sp. CRN 30 TaxID=3075613 RepID=UPI002A8246C2|nr:hypothetical protein [Streptomyces sp. CRN 30]